MSTWLQSTHWNIYKVTIYSKKNWFKLKLKTRCLKDSGRIVVQLVLINLTIMKCTMEILSVGYISYARALQKRCNYSHFSKMSWPMELIPPYGTSEQRRPYQEQWQTRWQENWGLLIYSFNFYPYCSGVVKSHSKQLTM